LVLVISVVVCVGVRGLQWSRGCFK